MREASAFRELYRRSSRSVFGVVMAVVRDPALSEEVVQEVFLEVWLNASSFDHVRGRGLSWIQMIARRRGIDCVRASQASRDRDRRAGAQDLGVPYDTATELVGVSDDLRQLRHALLDLTARERHVVELVHLQGHSHKEAALVLGVATGTIKSRMHRAMSTLRSALVC